MTQRVYLDSNATTRPLPEVRAAVDAAMEGAWGNPSSLHARGREAARALSTARGAVAAALGASATEVVFTSGGTEADRLGVLGTLAASGERRHIVASALEHPAIRSLLLEAPRQPWGASVDVTWVRPETDGAVRADAVRDAIRDDTALVAVHWANNETGVLQPVQEIAAVCRERSVGFLVDAVQAVGKVPVDFGALGAPLLAVSGHKVHGPKGVGALLVRSGAAWKPPFPASQEMRRRGGTEATGIVTGFATALEQLAADTDAPARMAVQRDRFERVVMHSLGDVSVNGTAPRTPNVSNLQFDGIDSERLLALLDRAGVDASNGSACSSDSPEPSHVLLAMGRSRRQAGSALRFSLSRFTTDAEIDRAASAVIESVETLRRRGGAVTASRRRDR
jgi:cysteine desulfurase